MSGGVDSSVVAGLLAREGYDVIATVDNGEEALRSLGEIDIDVVFVHFQFLGDVA